MMVNEILLKNIKIVNKLNPTSTKVKVFSNRRLPADSGRN